MAEGPKVLCRVRIVALRDARTDPETMGVLLDRAVKSPPDRDAWLKSIAGGLTARDIDVRFDEDDEKALAISLTLRTAWLSLLKSTKQASVVFRLEPGDAYSGKAARDYRASITATNWIGSRSEIQGMIDRAIAASLDQLAADLRQACGADFASPPH